MGFMNDPSIRRSKRPPFVRNTLMLLRRGHLYFGLLLMPWALLYGITGYLFNHPTHFPEANIRGIRAAVTHDTELSKIPSADIIAERVVTELNTRFAHESPLKLNTQKPIRYDGDFFIASAERSTETLQLLLYRDGSGGTMRVQKKEPPKTDSDVAYFAISPGNNAKPAAKESENTSKPPSDQALKNSTPLKLANSIDRYCVDSLPAIAERLDLEVEPQNFKVTTAPETIFHVLDRDREWTVRYNSITGVVSAKPANAGTAQSSSWRRFLLRMHTAHGYPIETNARWFWAIIVDIMAFVMVFWGLSGIIMWWQIKRTRPWGTVALVVSIVLATCIAIGMSML